LAQKKAKRNEESHEIEAVDLVALLTSPDLDGYYDNEITEDSLFKFDENYVEPESEPILAENQSIQAVEGVPVKGNRPQEKVSKPVAKNSPRKSTGKKLTDEELLSSIQSERKIETKPKLTIPEVVIVENDSLERIATEISECTKCELHQTRNKTVPGAGPGKTKLVFIGEAPGADEDASGIPFVGKAGKHLDKVIAAAGFKRDEVFICNILKCRPPGNRDPNFSEMVCCTPYLQRQLAILQPKLIACLGNVAIRYVVGPKTP
jgi:DNA polymerase